MVALLGGVGLYVLYLLGLTNAGCLMKKVYLWVIFLLPAVLFGMYAEPIGMNAISGGAGTWSDPVVCNSGEFSWRYWVPEKYRTDEWEFAGEVHLDWYRNCSTQFFSGPFASWEEFQNEMFYWDGFRAGTYYFRISARLAGSGDTFREISSSSRLHVYFELPPWESLDVGRIYKPANTVKPQVAGLTILNRTGGSGSSGDPWHFSGTEFQFDVNFTDSGGAYLWCIERLENGSPMCLLNPHRYMLSQGGGGDNVLSPDRAVSGTFAPLEFFDDVQVFDFAGGRCIASGNGKFKLIFEMMGAQGTYNRATYFVYFDHENIEGVTMRQAPLPPTGVRLTAGVQEWVE